MLFLEPATQNDENTDGVYFVDKDYYPLLAFDSHGRIVYTSEGLELQVVSTEPYYTFSLLNYGKNIGELALQGT